MVSIDLKRGLLATGDVLFDFNAEELRAEKGGLILVLYEDDDYVCELDLGEGALHMPDVSFSLPDDTYEVAQVSDFNLTLEQL